MNGNFSFPPPPPPPPPSSTTSSLDNGFQHRGGQGGVRRNGPSVGPERMRGRLNQNRGLFSGNEYQSHHGVHQNDPNQTKPPLHAPQTHRTQHIPQPCVDNMPSRSGVISPLGGLNESNQLQSSPPTTNPACIHPYHGPPRTFAGHKRKLDALRPATQQNRESRPPTAPAVPSFGTPISLPKPNAISQSRQTRVKNALGLTPSTADPHYSSSDEDVDDKDIDEEAMHAELGAKLTFEHNGVIMSLNSALDLAAWREERKKNWPTKGRVAEKEMEKRRTGEERRRLLASASALEKKSPATLRNENRSRISGKLLEAGSKSAKCMSTPEVDLARPETKLDLARKELVAQEKRLDALRKRVAQGQANLEKMQAEQQACDEPYPEELLDRPAAKNADHERQEDDSDTSTDLSESSVLSSDTGVEVELSDDDAPPEVSSSKPPPVASKKPLKPCRYFYASGYCRDGDACRFAHDVAPGAKQSIGCQKPQVKSSLPSKSAETLKARKGIFERLMERQLQEEDKLALQVIKHLGKVGFFNDARPREKV